MTHNIIKTENYLLIVDDSEIKEGKTLLSREGIIHTNIGWNYGDKVIIAHLPLNGAPVLEGVPLLPPLEDEVGELAQKYVEDEVKPDIEPRGYNQDLRIGIYGGSVTGFIYSYNKAKEKYKYTEFDIIKAFEYGWNQRHYGIIDENELLKIQKRFIQSLQQPKMPVAFECEVERIYPNPQTISKEYDFDDILIERKTTTNPQGQTVLVGKYIY
jgi:hypothetical protein